MKWYTTVLAVLALAGVVAAGCDESCDPGQVLTRTHVCVARPDGGARAADATADDGAGATP